MNLEPLSKDRTLIDRILEGLTRRKGKRYAIKSRQMVKILRSEGFKGVDQPKIRDVVHYLRTVRKVFICADNDGYYTPETTEEKEKQIRSLSHRIKETQEARDSLIEIINNGTQQGQIFTN